MNKQPIHIVTGDGRDMWVAANTDANPEFFDTREEAEKAISEELGLTQLKTKEIVQKTFDAVDI